MRRRFLITLLALATSFVAYTQCTFTQVATSSSAPLAACSTSTTINIDAGQILIDSDWDISGYTCDTFTITNGGQVTFTGDYKWILPTECILIFSSGGVVNYTGGKNILKQIWFGQHLVVTANGGNGTLSFEDIIAFGAIGYSGPLPVELSYFNILYDGYLAVIGWGTASESQCDYFTVMHSVDGCDFYDVGMLPGAGTSVTPKTYEYPHKPSPGTNLYKIRQFDFNGSHYDSRIKSIVVSRDGIDVKQYSNSVVVLANNPFAVFSCDGILVTYGNSGDTIYTHNWSPGTYFITDGNSAVQIIIH